MTSILTYDFVFKVKPDKCTAGHDIGHWPAGPTAIFSCRGQFGPQAFIFYWPEWATRQQFGPLVGLEDTGLTPLVALFAKPAQTTDGRQFIDGYLSPQDCIAVALFGFVFDDTTHCPVNYVAA